MLARFLTRNDFSYCTDCYQRIFTKCEPEGTEECDKCPGADLAPCWQCGLAITGRDRLRLVRRDRQWHQACLKCRHCNSPLAGHSFSWRQDQPYCLPCINRLFSKACEGCPKPIRNYLHSPAVLTQSRDSLLSESGGGRFISLAGRYWHTSCFLCTACSASLVDTGFIAEAQEILCQDCAEDRAAH